jgi:hypothetical protein
MVAIAGGLVRRFVVGRTETAGAAGNLGLQCSGPERAPQQERGDQANERTKTRSWSERSLERMSHRSRGNDTSTPARCLM